MLVMISASLVEMWVMPWTGHHSITELTQGPKLTPSKRQMWTVDVDFWFSE